MESKPIVFAVSKEDGSHLRIESDANAIYDSDRDEIVIAFRDSMHADTLFRIMIGEIRRGWQAHLAPELGSELEPGGIAGDSMPPGEDLIPRRYPADPTSELLE